jgi:NADH-ubiquinone oxidoreductase chain 2
MGFSLYYYTNQEKQYIQLTDKNNSPIQLISQIKGYFYINPFIALSLAITIFSFVGVPPFIGFFAKQMVLSAALDNGYIFITLIAILSSVVSAVYYLGIIKQIFFFKPDYVVNSALKNISLHGNIINNKNILIQKVTFDLNNLMLSSSLSITISILTLIISLFIFVPQE